MGAQSRGNELGGSLTTAVSDINITPFVDVVLVLLIIFMATAPQLLQGLEVDVPAAEAGPVALEEQHLLVSITRDRHVHLDEREVDADALRAALIAAKRDRVDARLYIKADREVPYGAVVEVMGAARAAGLQHIGMITAPTPSDETARAPSAGTDP
ncbi:MAG: biopolymer transporter ExbD [Myxococcales bacterium]|nr:biopolymer transporter ExbD [Myxococcales bacterium]